jgi:hypothetical protein
MCQTRPSPLREQSAWEYLWCENMVILPVAGSRGGGGIGLAPRADGLHEWAPLPYPSAAPASTSTEEGIGWRRRGKGQAPRVPPHSAASGSRPGWRVGCTGNPKCRRRTTPRRTADIIEPTDREAIRFPCFFRPHRFGGHLQETAGPHDWPASVSWLGQLPCRGGGGGRAVSITGI